MKPPFASMPHSDPSGSASPAGAPQPPTRQDAAGPIAAGPALLVVTLAGAVLLLHAWTYAPFISDDALISLRYAARFLQGRGLTWNDGERVEGYSNLLWILMVAGLGRCGADLIRAARVLGCLGSLATLAAVVYAYPPRRAVAGGAGSIPGGGPGGGGRIAVGSIVPALTGTLGLALTGPVAIWTIGGLEQPLLAALLTWALVLLFPLFDGQDPSARGLLGPGLLLGFAVLTRPDAPLFTVAACLALLMMRGVNRGAIRSAAILAAVPLLFYLGQLGFRLAWYGDWLPNPAYAKVAFTSTRLVQGLAYVGTGLLKLSPLLVLGALAPLAARVGGFRRGRTVLLITVALVWLAYVAVIGGDLFPGWRQLVVIAAIAALLAAGGLTWLVAAARRPGVVWLGAPVLLLGLVLLQARDAENRRAREELWEWDGQSVGEMLGTGFAAEQPLLAVDAAGCLPYFSRLPSIDMLGINDRHIARHRPPDFGQGWIGHELGDGAYVMDRQPDLVIFTLPQGGMPTRRSGQEMLNDPRFLETYQPVQFEGEAPRPWTSLIWVRRDGGRIGIRRDGERIRVPGFLLAPSDRVGAPIWQRSDSPRIDIGSGALDAGGAIGCPLRAGTIYVLAGLPVPAGRWTIALDPPTDGVRLGARCGAVEAICSSEGHCAIAVPSGGDGRVDVKVMATAASGAHVRALTLERVGGDP